MKVGTHVLVTTDKDKMGVFVGKFKARKDLQITLTEVQMCVRWSEDVRGVMGLAATGPTSNCRISKPAPESVIEGITMVTTLSGEAVEAFSKSPWKI